MQIRILVIENSPRLRGGLASRLSEERWISGVEEASTYPEAIAKAKTFSPHIVVIDHCLPEIDGIATTKRIMKLIPSASVIVFCLLCDDTDAARLEAMAAGAYAYVGQCLDVQRLTDEIKRAATGKILQAAMATSHQSAPHDRPPGTGYQSLEIAYGIGPAERTAARFIPLQVRMAPAYQM